MDSSFPSFLSRAQICASRFNSNDADSISELFALRSVALTARSGELEMWAKGFNKIEMKAKDKKLFEAFLFNQYEEVDCNAKLRSRLISIAMKGRKIRIPASFACLASYCESGLLTSSMGKDKMMLSCYKTGVSLGDPEACLRFAQIADECYRSGDRTLGVFKLNPKIKDPVWGIISLYFKAINGGTIEAMYHLALFMRKYPQEVSVYMGKYLSAGGSLMGSKALVAQESIKFLDDASKLDYLPAKEYLAQLSLMDYLDFKGESSEGRVPKFILRQYGGSRFEFYSSTLTAETIDQLRRGYYKAHAQKQTH